MRLLVLSMAAILMIGLTSAFYTQSRLLDSTQNRLSELEPSQIDIGFSQSMAIHHEQAITMAQLLLDGRPTALTTLAKTIAGKQLLELGEMHGWLRIWQQDFFPASKDMVWLLMGAKALDESMQKYVIDCGNSADGMPGLASREQLQQLRLLEGRERDTLFLQLMLAHHEGGVPMARFAAEESRLLAVRTVAANMVLDQSKEIQQMRTMLKALDYSR
jgi:uncharacterized protein (DUF305 family)